MTMKFGAGPVHRLLMCALALVAPAFGLDPRLSLQQYLHTSWTRSEGQPVPEVNALAQTADGYLWLGTNRGLMRFDGLRFSKPRLPEGTPDQMVRTLAASRSEYLWVGTRSGLAKFDGSRLTRASGPFGLPSAAANAVLEDRSGKLWFGGATSSKATFAVFDPARSALVPIAGPGVPADVVSLNEDKAGVVWIDSGGQIYSCSASGPQYRCEPSRPAGSHGSLHVPLLKAVLHDSDGNFWIGTVGQGLFCLRGGVAERFTQRDGLSSDAVLALLEDREGNIWVGTANGIDRFRQPKVARWSSLQGLAGNVVTAIRTTKSGDLWIATAGGGLDRIRDNRIFRGAPLAGLRRADVLALFEDARQTLWMGTTRGVGAFDGKTFKPVRARDGAFYDHVQAFAQDGEGVIWLADSTRGLASIRDGWIAPSTLSGLPAARVHQLGTDRQGNLWVGYVGGGVVVAGSGGVRSVSVNDGLASGPVQAFYQDSAGSMWVGAAEGVSRLRGGKWLTWTAADGLPAGGVQAFAEDAHGWLWLVTRSGLAPVKLADLDERPRARGQGKPRLSLLYYGPNDGVRMPEIGGVSNSRLAVSPDGRIWLATADGLAVVDPATIRSGHTPPPVIIEPVRLPPGSTLSAIHGHSVEIEYTALSLTLPEAVRFRYRLEPLESEWVDAGTRREIAYANLAPGSYRFRVTARDEDGIWNSTAAALAFTVAPEFYQTWAFWSSCACLLALGALSLYKARIHRLRTRFQIVLQERTRLSRELHDTLLQGFAGVVYQLEAATRQMETQPEAGRRRLAQALEQADRSLREARQALSCMRLTDLENSTLAEAVRRAGERIVDGSSIEFQMEVTGRSRELPYDVQANLFVIAREALNNAVAHGSPGHITVKVDYRGEAVALAVQDNGTGFELDSGHRKPDHWGLDGMRERARHIGAEFAIQTEPGRGTTVEVVVNKVSRKLD